MLAVFCPNKQLTGAGLSGDHLADANTEKVVKIIDGDEEMYCWSGAPKRKRSPVKCDEPIGCFQPVMRQPRHLNTSAKPTTVHRSISNGDSSVSSAAAHEHMQEKRQKVLAARVVADHADVFERNGSSEISTGKLTLPHGEVNSMPVSVFRFENF